MFRLSYLGRGPTGTASEPDQFLRVQRAATVVALVAARAVIGAVGACAFDVSVRQESLVVRAEGLTHRVCVKIALVQEAQEHILGDFSVVLGVCRSKQVEADSEAFPRVQELRLEFGVNVLRGDALLVGGDGDRGAMSVAAGYHRHLIAYHPVIAREYIGGQICARSVAKVDGAVGVWPSYGYEYAFGHRSSFRLTCSIMPTHMALY